MTQDLSLGALFEKFREKDADKGNPKSTWEMDRVINHLHSEASEIWDALRRGKPREQVVEEVSDALNLVVIIAARLHISVDELVRTSHAKFDEVAQREANGNKN